MCATGRACTVTVAPQEVAETACDALDAPVRRYAAMAVPVPFSPALEDATIPNVQGLISIVKELF